MTSRAKRAALVTLALMLPSLSGCFTASARQIKGDWHDGSHKPDAVLEAHTLPDQNIVVLVQGRLSGSEELVSFSLFVSRSELDQLKLRFVADHGARAVFNIKAPIVMPPQESRPEWSSLKLSMSSAPLEERGLPSGDVPVLYVGPAQWGDRWGHAKMIYVETFSDGTPFRCEIHPMADRLTHERDWRWWLPLTVPLDIVTLPLQAVWAVIAAVGLAGAK
jgi:hypothetical protein